MRQLLIAISIFGFSIAAVANDGPCKTQAEAKHAARKALHECLESWAQDRKPTDADPSDDCSAKLSGFVTAAKTVKACRVEAHAKKDAK
jgi:hypothetical protein